MRALMVYTTSELPDDIAPSLCDSQTGGVGEPSVEQGVCHWT